MTLTIKQRCGYATMKQWREGGNLPASQIIVEGVKVQYVAHIPGGMVKVSHNGKEVVIHPSATVELA